MTIRKVLRSAATMLAISTLAACGTYVPQLHEPWEEADLRDTLLVTRIKNSIYCELRQAVHQLTSNSVDPGRIDDRLIPRDYGVQMTLMLQVDETGALNPGISVSKGIGGSDLFNFGASGIVSSQATKIDTTYSFFSADSLKEPLGPFDSSCGIPQAPGVVLPLDRHGSSPLLSGDLGILAWLRSAINQQDVIPSDRFPSSASKKVDVLSYRVKFIVITTGTANPMFKFVNLSTGSAPPLFSANRTRTHDLLITLGPDVELPPKGTKNGRTKTLTAPGEAAFGLHLSAEIGAAVAGALR